MASQSYRWRPLQRSDRRRWPPLSWLPVHNRVALKDEVAFSRHCVGCWASARLRGPTRWSVRSCWNGLSNRHRTGNELHGPRKKLLLSGSQPGELTQTLVVEWAIHGTQSIIQSRWNSHDPKCSTFATSTAFKSCPLRLVITIGSSKSWSIDMVSFANDWNDFLYQSQSSFVGFFKIFGLHFFLIPIRNAGFLHGPVSGLSFRAIKTSSSSKKSVAVTWVGKPQSDYAVLCRSNGYSKWWRIHRLN